MAADHPSDHHRGEMDIAEQVNTFENVFDKGLLRMGSLAVACLVLFLTLTFCTPAGFIPAAIITVVLAIAGAIFLRKQPTSDQTL